MKEDLKRRLIAAFALAAFGLVLWLIGGESEAGEIGGLAMLGGALLGLIFALQYAFARGD